jgi:hypothetical protein
MKILITQKKKNNIEHVEVLAVEYNQFSVLKIRGLMAYSLYEAFVA